MNVTLTVISALACGLVTGLLYGFSVMVMPAFNEVPPDNGVAVMQAVNRVANRNPLFLLVFVGSAGLAVAMIVMSVVDWGAPGHLFALLGGVVYLFGVIGVTAVFHIPRNNALAAFGNDGVAANAYWPTYLNSWTAGNHVRTALGVAGTALMILAVVR